MRLHLLSGDSLVEPIAISGVEGEVFVCRECLIDGPRDTSSLESFWESRKEYLSANYDAETEIDYDKDVAGQYIDLWNAADGKEVVLWFERELFCQINMYFSLWMLRNTDARFSVVYPVKDGDYNPWLNWSMLSSEELVGAFEQRVRMNHDDVFQIVGLWEAFASGNISEMRNVATSRTTEALPTVERIVELVDTFDEETERIVSESIATHGSDFAAVFGEFAKEFPQYGLGDLQVKKIFDRLVKS